MQATFRSRDSAQQKRRHWKKADGQSHAISSGNGARERRESGPSPATSVGGPRSKKKKNPEQIGKEAGRTEDGRGATPRGISTGTTRPEEVRQDRARESETSSRGREGIP